MGKEIIYSFWKIVWNIRVCEKRMYFVKKKKQANRFGILFWHPWY
jgi:hypothetical protein